MIFEIYVVYVIDPARPLVAWGVFCVWGCFCVGVGRLLLKLGDLEYSSRNGVKFDSDWWRLVEITAKFEELGI